MFKKGLWLDDEEEEGLGIILMFRLERETNNQAMSYSITCITEYEVAMLLG